MNKFFTKIAGLALGLAMAIGVGAGISSKSSASEVSAADSTVTLNTSFFSVSGTSYATKSVSHSASGVTFNITDCNGNSSKLTMKAKTGEIYNSTGFSNAKIKSIALSGITFSSSSSAGFYVYGGTSSKATTTTILNNTGSTTATTLDFSSYNYNYFYIKNKTSRTCGFSSIVITYGSATQNYTVTYNAGLGRGEHAADTVTAGQSVTLPDSGFSRDGYTFDGWATTSSGSKAYDLGASYKPTANVTLFAHYAANPYAVVHTYKNCSGTAPVVTYHGNTINDTLTPNTGYHLPSSVSVKVGETTSSYSILNNKLTIPNVTGNVVYTVEAILNSYNVSGSITNGSLSNTGSISHGTAFSGTITPTSDYHLPDSITVTIGGASSSNFTYNSSTGVVEISDTYVTGDIVVTGTCYMEYAILASAVNGSVSSSPLTIKDYDTASITFAADSGYILPGVDGISVTNATIVNYDDGLVEIGSPTGPVTVVCTCIQGGYRDITVQMEHVTYSGTGTEVIEAGGGATVVITADSGYRLPAQSAFTVTGADAAYSFNGNQVTITLSNCVDNVVISATAIQTFEVTSSITNGSASPASGTVDAGSTFSTTLSANAHYKLPSSISVTMGGAATQSFTYNSSTGAVSVTNISGAVVITASMAVLANYNVTCNLTNVSKTSGPATVEENGSATYVFAADSGYGLPDSVTVLNASSTWTKASGTLVISNPTNDVSITIVGDEDGLESITLSTTTKNYTLGDDFVMPVVTAHYKYGADKVVTSEATQTGYDPYTEGTQSVVISYTEGGETQTQNYTAVVQAKSVDKSYVKVSSVSDITEGDYIIAYSTYGFDGRDAGSAYTSVTIVNNKIAQSTATDKLAAHITPVTDGYTIKVSETSDNNAGKYVNFTTNKNTLAFTDNSQTMSISNASSSTHATYATGGAFAIGDSSTVLSFNNTTGTSNQRYRFYKTSTTTGQSGSNYFAVDLYKLISTGAGDLIRITATYSHSGNQYYAGDSVVNADFTVDALFNTGDVTHPTDFTITNPVLSAGDNTIVLSYTIGGITKTCSVLVANVPERTATVTCVELIQGQGVVTQYYIRGQEQISWDYTGLSVRVNWSDDTYDDYSLASLVSEETATISPSRPSVGVTSFSVDCTLEGTQIEENSVSVTVSAKVISSISWSPRFGGQAPDVFEGTKINKTEFGTVTAKYNDGTSVENFSINNCTVVLRDGTDKTSDIPVIFDANGDYTAQLAHSGRQFFLQCEEAESSSAASSKITVTPSLNDITKMVEGEIEAKFVAADQGWTNAQVVESFDIDSNVSVTSSTSGTNKAKYYDTGLAWRVYATGTFTITCDSTISKIELLFASGEDANAISASPGSYSEAGTSPNKVGTWTGSSSSVTFSVGGSSGHRRIKGINVTYSGGQTPMNLANKNIAAQKAVIEFANYVMDTMDDVCEDFNTESAEFISAWNLVQTKYNELFGTSSTNVDYAIEMLKYAQGKVRGTVDSDILQNAMGRYDTIVAKDSSLGFITRDPLALAPSTTRANSLSVNFNSSATIVIVISLVSVSALGTRFFIRRRKEN